MAIGHISDTARWVAYYRAMETDRPDALFKDPYARRLAGLEGEAIVNALPRGRAMAWALIVRTAVFDEMIRLAVAERGVKRVVNLAAGLDARPWRLTLPPSLEWIDVDLPDVLTFKAEAIGGVQPGCRYSTEALDLTSESDRAAFLARLRARPAISLVVTEGLLIYLTEAQVGGLAADLYQVPEFRWWLIDLASPRLLQYTNRYWGRAAEAGHAAFQFAPADGSGFFGRFGWWEIEFRSASDEARRLKREMRLAWLWRRLMKLASADRREAMRRMAGYILLERAEPGMEPVPPPPIRI